jgi:hypothetical protein
MMSALVKNEGYSQNLISWELQRSIVTNTSIATGQLHELATFRYEHPVHQKLQINLPPCT